MKDAKAFLRVKREEARSRPVSSRIRDYAEVHIPRPPETSARQASRCMDCGTPFCHWGCPAGNRIPEWNSLLTAGRIEEAFMLLQSTNNFPEITGRLCPALCEHSCVLGIDEEPVTIRQNELEITEQAFKKGLLKPSPPGRRTGRRIAVAGSGPAGLAAADILNKSGHSVTVYEKADAPGGMLRYGIPNFKLDKNVLDRRLEVLEAEGIKFITGEEAGENLIEEFDAVCLAGGCRRPRDLDIPGRGLPGVYFAMDYLSAANRKARGEIMPSMENVDAGGKKVVIIGGGDTGADCLGTALRQKAESVAQVELFPEPPAERTPENPWPFYANVLKKSSSHREGGTRLWKILTEEFLGQKNSLRGIRCSKAEFCGKTGGMKKISGSTFTLEADMAVIAVGFAGAEPGGLAERLTLRLDERGRVETDSSFMTSRGKVFAAGDIRRGQSLIVHAMAEGRACARSIYSFLGSKTD